MSDSESSDITDSEAMYESENDDYLDSDEIDAKENEDDDNTEEENEEDDETEEENDDQDNYNPKVEDNLDESEQEEETKLMSEERKRLYMDDLSSDDEEAGNTIGNIPLKWYDQYDHIGYDLDGNKIMRPTKDAIDDYIRRREDPNYKWTIVDEKNGTERIMTQKERDIITNLVHGRFPDSTFNEYQDLGEYFTSDRMDTPLSAVPPTKRSFVPSKWEKLKVMKMYYNIINGKVQPKKEKKDEMNTYMMWDNNDQSEEFNNKLPRLEAPKMPLPGHKESYNPPKEYLLTAEEEAEELNKHPDDRIDNFIPKQYDCLRHVPLYSNFIKERFDRCLDLYVCPRQLKRKVQIDPKLLIPKLPSPSELRPFPTTQSILYNDAKGRVRSISVDPTGQYLATASEDLCIRIYEIETSRLLYIYKCTDICTSLAWNPSLSYSCLCLMIKEKLYFINVYNGNDEVFEATKDLLYGKKKTAKPFSPFAKYTYVTDKNRVTIEQDIQQIALDYFNQVDASEGAPETASVYDNDLCDPDDNAMNAMKTGIQLIISHKEVLRSFTWHHKGDYIGTVLKQQGNTQVIIHQLSKSSLQNPFSKCKGIVQLLSFHPSKPFLFVCTQTEVRVYNLQQQSIIKKLRSSCKYISTIAIHPSGDHVIVGSYDRRLCWFDMDLSSLPYKTLKYHKKAVRKAVFHPEYPLMASCSDEGFIHVFYAKTYNDFINNPLIVPVKVLKGHEVINDLGVLDIAFHPKQPWIISSGADHTVRLFVNIP